MDRPLLRSTQGMNAEQKDYAIIYLAAEVADANRDWFSLPMVPLFLANIAVPEDVIAQTELTKRYDAAIFKNDMWATPAGYTRLMEEYKRAVAPFAEPVHRAVKDTVQNRGLVADVSYHPCPATPLPSLAFTARPADLRKILDLPIDLYAVTWTGGFKTVRAWKKFDGGVAVGLPQLKTELADRLSHWTANDQYDTATAEANARRRDDIRNVISSSGRRATLAIA